MKSYRLYHRYWPYPVMGAAIHSSFHCVQNQIETFRHRCTPTDKHEQSLKLNLYSCVLGFLRAVWCDSSVKQSSLARLFCVRYQTNLANVRLIFPLYRWLSYGCLCGSHKRTLLIQADIFLSSLVCFLFAKFFTSELHSKLNGVIWHNRKKTYPNKLTIKSYLNSACNEPRSFFG